MELSAALEHRIQTDLARFVATNSALYSGREFSTPERSPQLLKKQLQAEQNRAAQKSPFYCYRKHIRLLTLIG